MLLVIVGGLVLLGLFVLFGWLWGSSAIAMGIAAKAFIPVWLIVSLVNLYIGVSQAGYSLREELPILLIVFAVPAALAVLAIWRLLQS